MRKVLFAALFLCASIPLAHAADPVGHYAIDGQVPNGNRYSGTVDVTKTGDTYRVVWLIGKDRYVGTGIGDKTFIATTFKSGNTTGLALYGAQGDDWSGAWTYSGDSTLGTERWVRQ